MKKKKKQFRKMSGFDCWVPKNSKKFQFLTFSKIKHQNFSLKIHYTNPLSLSHAMALSACVQFLVKFLTVVRYDDLPHVQFAVNTICPRPLQVWTLVWGGRADRKWKKTPGWPEIYGREAAVNLRVFSEK